MRLEGGTQFAGYGIQSRLGRGGMATVYLAREPGLDRLVALKVLPEHLGDDPEFAGRFEQEARVIAGLDHPNIIPLYRFGITDDVPWMALRYVDGGDFAARLVSRPLAVPEGLEILRLVASALDYAHRKGVVHRDLKPQNILLTREGAPYLADFGVAKLLEGSGKLKTATGGILGTPAYMAPEQAQGFQLGPYTDIYALAIIAFQWLTGSLPFDADTPHAILMKQVTNPVPQDKLDLLEPAVAAVLERGLAKQPEERYATAGEFVADLERALYAEETSTPAPAPAPVQRTSQRARVVQPPPPAPSTGSKAPFIWMGAILAVLVLAFASYVVWRETRPEPRAIVVNPTPAPAPKPAPPAPTPAPQSQPQPEPVKPAPRPAPTPQPAPAPIEETVPEPAPLDADSLVARNVEALGGASRIRGLRSGHLQGMIYNADGTQVAFEIWVKRPDKYKLTLTALAGSVVQVYDGGSAWYAATNGLSGALTPGQTKELAYGTDFGGKLYDYRAKGRRAKYLGIEDVNGVSTHAVQITHANSDVDVAYLDPDTFLPVREITRHHVDGALVVSTFDYSDYRTVNGVKVPFTADVTSTGGTPAKFRAINNVAEFNVPADDGLFSP